MPVHRAITDVPGIAVGHSSDLVSLTGCTVVLCEAGAVGGAFVLGGAPGTRETDLLRPENLVDRVHAVLLCGGSAFGLAAADGVVRYLEGRGIGFATPAGPVPIVPAAVLYDLMIGSATVRPDAAMGDAACRDARRGPVEEGCVGAGTGATVGKLFGPAGAMKSGVGTWSTQIPGGAIVGALVATNAFGDVLDARTGAILAGARDPETSQFAGTSTRLQAGPGAGDPGGAGLNTTIGVVATDAPLSKAEATRLAVLAHAGLARVVSPSHTSLDGDTFFVLSLSRPDGDVLAHGSSGPARVVAHAVGPGPSSGYAVGPGPGTPGGTGRSTHGSAAEPFSRGAAWLSLQAAVADVVAEAVMRSVRFARTLGGVPGLAG